MKISLANNSFFAFCLFFMIVTINNTVVTIQSYEIITLIRIVLTLLLGASFIIILYKGSHYISSLFVWLFLLIYYLLLTYIFNFEPDLTYVLDFIIIIAGVFVLLQNFMLAGFDERKFTYFILFYFILTVIMIISTDGFLSYLPPKFSFSYGSTLIDREEDYSLGLTSFFGMTAITLFYGFINKYRYSKLLLLLSLLSIILSFSSGARGEFIIALVVTLSIFLIYNFNYKILFIFVTIIIIALFISLLPENYFLEKVDLDSFVIIDRMMILLSGDFSSRDTLLKEGFNLLIDKPVCLFMGCGIGFFQEYYGYSKSLYPHNFLMEFIISYGFILFFAFMLPAFLGFLSYMKAKHKSNLFCFLFSYFFLISMKSGYMIGSWFAFASLLFFINFYFYNSLKRRLSL